MQIFRLKSFSLIIKTLLFLLKIGIIIVIIKYGFDLYQVINLNHDFLSHLFSQDGIGEMLGSSKEARSNNLVGLQKLGIYMGKLTLFMALKWFILAMIIKVINKLPLPSKLIAFWVDNDDLNLTLGRYLASNFRIRKTLSIRNLLRYIDYADLDRYYLYQAHKNENLRKLMSRYQADYVEEIEN